MFTFRFFFGVKKNTNRKGVGVLFFGVFCAEDEKMFSRKYFS